MSLLDAAFMTSPLAARPPVSRPATCLNGGKPRHVEYLAPAEGDG